MTCAVAEAVMNGGKKDDFIDAMKKYFLSGRAAERRAQTVEKIYCPDDTQAIMIKRGNCWRSIYRKAGGT